MLWAPSHDNLLNIILVYHEGPFNQSTEITVPASKITRESVAIWLHQKWDWILFHLNTYIPEILIYHMRMLDQRSPMVCKLLLYYLYSSHEQNYLIVGLYTIMATIYKQQIRFKISEKPAINSLMKMLDGKTCNIRRIYPMMICLLIARFPIWWIIVPC